MTPMFVFFLSLLTSLQVQAHSYKLDNGTYHCQAQSCQFDQSIRFDNPDISSEVEAAILNRLEAINKELVPHFKIPEVLNFGIPWKTNYNAYYMQPGVIIGEGIHIGYPFLQTKTDSVLLPILTHEYGHAIFEQNVMKELYAHFGLHYKLDDNRTTKALRAFVAPLNELYADVVAHLFDMHKMAEAFNQVAGFARNDQGLLEEDRTKLGKHLSTPINACRDYEGKNTKLKWLYLFKRKTHLQTHLILCPTASVVWKKLQGETDNKKKLKRLGSAFSKYIKENFEEKVSAKLLKKKHRFNKQLTQFLEENL